MLLPTAANLLVFLDLHTCPIHSFGESVICFDVCRTYRNEDDCLKFEDVAYGEAILAMASSSSGLDHARC